MNSGKNGPLATVKRGLASYWRLVKPPSDECQNCGTVISTGSPHHPFCSDECREERWQAMQW